MKVFIDGIEYPVATNVKVIYEDEIEDNAELHITLTHEGVINDSVENDEITGTEWMFPHDIFFRIY